ncbi:amidase [Taklimakanibacter lacteus]|uniref:amidase n=1 Tax=Taklimakanibacter lacteus TaxID=2268456 RepID=UPI000E66F044
MTFKPLRALAHDLDAGAVTAQELVETALARIQDPAGEGARAFLTLDGAAAVELAQFYDRQRRAGRSVPPFAGIPVGAKDLFDIKGQVTRAGSAILANAPPAQADAPAIARVKAAGFIVVGRNNMTEFAYSGVGLNPHYGTPRSPYDRKTGRIPGGSSSGAGVAVADGMVPLAIGTDTGGSCRIPAAYNGVVGYKPSTGRIPTAGAYPLSKTLDSIGPLARTVECCALTDAVLAGDWDGVIAPPRHGLRFAVPRSYFEGTIDEDVAAHFDRALSHLGEAGIAIAEVAFDELSQLPAINSKGGISAVEAMLHHRAQIASLGEGYDQRVRRRIELGALISAPDYADLLAMRKSLIAQFNRGMTGFDALVMPTTCNIAPAISALARDEEYLRLNFLSLRNTFTGNFLDCCGISLPMHKEGEPPTGLMLMAPHGQDQQVFSAAQAVESALASLRSA